MGSFVHIFQILLAHKDILFWVHGPEVYDLVVDAFDHISKSARRKIFLNHSLVYREAARAGERLIMGQTCLLCNLAQLVDGALVDYSHGGNGGALEVYVIANWERQREALMDFVCN
jgi:hypothetical protein